MITSAHYTNPAPSQAVRIATQGGAEWHTDASLPPDTEIRRVLHDWLAAGGAIAPYVEPPPPVRSIHKAWFRAALANAGHIAAVDAAVKSAGAVKWELWSNATEISEADPDVNAIAAALKIDLAAIFDAAFSIRDARGA